MRDHLFGLKASLLIATGLGAGLAGGCLEYASLDECLETAREDSADAVEVISFYVPSTEPCPPEDAERVKEAAREEASFCSNEPDIKYIACGPETPEPELGECTYVVVYKEPLQGCGVVGRPFLVEGAERCASVHEDPSWAGAVELDGLPESVALREGLARHYTQAALMEHASVAAFARFGVQLLALGAPSELLRACHAAMADETRHARLCFGLATRLAGTAVGPGPLEIEGALATAADPASILRDVVIEGCLGETRAALEARVAADRCRSPKLAAMLRSIAADEERHAALAWRFVAWVLDTRPELAGAFEAALAEALAQPQLHTPDAVEGSEAWGVLDHAQRIELDRAVRRELLAPLGRQLLGRHALSRRVRTS